MMKRCKKTESSLEVGVLLLGRCSGLRDRGLLLAHEELHVARAAHVRADAAVGAEGAAAHAGRLVHLDVLDDHLAGLQSLSNGVGFGVLQQRHDGCYGLSRPSAFGYAPLLALARAADFTGVAAKGDAAGLCEHLPVQLLGLAERHAVDHIGCLERVLEVAAEVADLSMGSFGRHLGFSGVVNHGTLLLTASF